MAFDTFGSVVVVSPVGQIPRAYLVRTADKQIALLDNRTITDGFIDYACHTFTGNEPDRANVKKILRVKVYGSGTIDPPSPAVPADRVESQPSGIMTITADNTRTDVYLYSELAADPTEGILWSQGCLGLKARTFDIRIQLHGVGLELREISLEYTVIS